MFDVNNGEWENENGERKMLQALTELYPTSNDSLVNVELKFIGYGGQSPLCP